MDPSNPSLVFLKALIQSLGDEDYSFSLPDPGGGDSWDVYYVISDGKPYTLAIRLEGDGPERRVQVGLLEPGTLSTPETRRALALQAPN